MERKIATKEYLLDLTDGGILFYKMVISDLIIEGDKCKNCRNPFYNDKNGSFSIYKNGDNWLFKDFGSLEYSGDVFTFAAFKYDLREKEDFKEILKKMLSEFLLFEQRYYKLPLSPIKNTIEIIRRNNNKFLPHELSYFKKYGITEEILHEYKVIPIDGYQKLNPNGKSSKVERNNGQVIVAYERNGFAKIYSPNPKFFLFTGQKPKDLEYHFGIDMIDFGGNGELLFMTGGEKDVLTLAAMGYNAISLNSETVYPSNKLMNELYANGYRTIVLYDIDETGKNMAEKISEKFGLSKIVLPNELAEKGGKDISDFIKLGFTKKQFDHLVKKVLKNALPISEVSEESEANEIQLKENKNLFFDNSIYKKLPPLLEHLTDLFKDLREKDVFLLSCITTLSNMFPKVSGRYNREDVDMNLFTFVVAPASAGKGVLKYAKILGLKLHEQLRTESKTAQHEFAQNKENSGIFLEQPPQKCFFIPANSSSSAILKNLTDNEGYGIIYETEADTLSETLGKEWGNFSDTLRKGFHGEAVSFQRMGNREFVDIPSARFSVLLSGTPGQVKRLIPNPENGLFSRFIFYYFELDCTVFKNVFEDTDEVSIPDQLKAFGELLYEFYFKLKEREKEIVFVLSTEQQLIFQKTFSQWQIEYAEMVSIDMVGTIRRLGLITFRISMILSIARLIAEETLPNKIICLDQDFDTALKISDCLKDHAINIFKSFNKRDGLDSLSHDLKRQYFKELPIEFNRDIANKVAEGLAIKLKSAEKYLETYIKIKLLQKPSHNLYRKV